MKDINEYGRTTKKIKEDKRLHLGRVTLEFGSAGSLTDENLDTFLKDIKMINVLTLRGLMPDMTQNLKYITEKLEKHNVTCGQIRAEITI